MSLNTSSSSSSPLQPNLSSAVADSCLNSCFFTTPSSIIFIAICITNNLLLLPLCIFILYLGVKQWQRQRPASISATISHSDSFTFHMVTMELTGVFGLTLACCSVLHNNCHIFDVGYRIASLTWYGEAFFHVLTCVERYLAVVHPISYVSLRNERGIRIRNICNRCVWLLSAALTCLQSAGDVSRLVNFCLVALCLIIVSFCSLGTLFVLIRPGPGDQRGKRERVDQLKKKAFYAIVAILSVLVLRFGWNLAWFGGWEFGEVTCVVVMSGMWSNLPGTLVLPLLFLLRAGTFKCCKTTPNEESE